MTTIPIVGDEGYVPAPIEELSEDEISTASAHLHAIGELRAAETEGEQNDALDGLAGFQGVVIHGVALVTDPEIIRQLDLDDRLPDTFYSDGP